MVLVVLAVQMLGGMALASPCSEACPEDARGGGCPPICALCTSCTHGQTAIVRSAMAGEPVIVMQELVVQQRVLVSSQRTDDIFHVPLPG